MSKSSQAAISPTGSREGWRIAIQKAEEEIAKAKARIDRLNISIGVFKECQQKGEPWPGTSAVEAKNENSRPIKAAIP